MNTYRKNTITKTAGVFLRAMAMFLLTAIISAPWAWAVDPPTMHDYTALPPFIDQSVKPNILIMLDNSGSMNYYLYEGQVYNPNENYYGYFTSEFMYYYDSNRFVIDNTLGKWSGNFLNFLATRRLDAMRKVITGGKANSAQGTGALRLNIDASDRDYEHIVRYIGNDVSPFNGDYAYGVMNDGNIYVIHWSDRDKLFDKKNVNVYTSVVQKDPDLEPEESFYMEKGEWRIGGVMQSFGNDANWGNMFFVEDNKNNRSHGGAIANPVQSVGNFANMITSLRNENADKWTPLAESYYVAMQHFKQEAPEVSGYASNAAATNHDPFDDSEWCAKNFVLVLTDGASTMDTNLPSYLKDYADTHSPSFYLYDDDPNYNGDPDGSAYWESTNTNVTNDYFSTGGSDFLKDVVSYARTNNLRDDIDGFTYLIPYIVFAFEEDPNARKLLMEAARQGGYRRQINDNIPGLDSNNNYSGDRGDLIPDNFFEAKTGRDLENALRNAILGILNRAASGTAASVVTPDGRGEGEGSVIQAYFVPVRTSDEHELRWSGYLHSLWIDPCGNLREDSNGNQQLDYASDKIVGYSYYDDQGALVQRFDPIYDAEEGLVCPAFDPESPEGQPFEMHELDSIFEAGEMLWKRVVDPDAADYDADEDRRIYTYKPDAANGLVEFRYTMGDEDIIPYLGVNDASVAATYDLNHLGTTIDERAEVLIDYIRGIDRDGLRNRTIDIDDEEHVWKLGNIVNSTPVVIGGAVEQYHLIYSDTSYRDYQRDQRGRETMVYVGANDGMLHAFTHGTYDRENMRFDPVDSAIGTESWSYIPRALLPHLKWLADPDYTHVFYADLQPKVFDAKISTKTESGWGTFLLLGLNKGGKRIYINIDGTAEVIYPSFTLIDITNPQNPEVMWERSYDGSGLTSSMPAIFKVGEDWFAAFGSGPNDETGKTDYEGRSDQKSKIFIINLSNGTPFGTGGNDWFAELTHDNAFLNAPTAFDKNINYNVDALYFGETYLDSKDVWRGNVYKVNIPCDPCDFTPDYEELPSAWSYSRLFESPGPITAQLNMRRDPDDNVMVYFGTGRYLSLDDKNDQAQQYLFGIKDPFYDARDEDGYYLNYNNDKTVTMANSNLFYANPIDVTDQGYVFNQTGLVLEDGTWEAFVSDVRENYDGWYRTLETFSGFPSERIISRPGLVGGTLLVPTFVPNDDVCEPLGESNILALYYQTGTGFRRHVLSPDESPGTRKHPDFVDAQAITAIKFKQTLVGAPASTITFHTGGGNREYGILQLDTAQQWIFEYDPDLQRSRITGWRDR